MEPIKVLILDTVMDRGGAEAMTMNYMRNMDRTKVQYDFLVHRPYKAAYEDEIEELGGEIFRICPVYPQNFLKYKREIRQFLKEHTEYKIIHCNMMELGYFAYKEAHKQGLPVIISHSHTSQGTKKYNLKYLYRLYFRKKFKQYITHMFACGIEAGDWLYGKKNRDQFIIQNNAIDAKKYEYNPMLEDEIKREFNIQGKYVIGHVGRFFSPKNHMFIIDVFNEIHKKNNECVLMLVGGGEREDKLMNKVKEKVKMLGLSDAVIFTGVRSDVNRILQAFDVFVLPSLYEGFPVVMVEAQAAGLKCLISDNIPIECDITGNVEVISLKQTAEYWADRILSYKDSYEKESTYKKIVDSKFDIKANAEWLQNFYIESIRNER